LHLVVAVFVFKLVLGGQKFGPELVVRAVSRCVLKGLLQFSWLLHAIAQTQQLQMHLHQGEIN